MVGGARSRIDFREIGGEACTAEIGAERDESLGRKLWKLPLSNSPQDNRGASHRSESLKLLKRSAGYGGANGADVDITNEHVWSTFDHRFYNRWLAWLSGGELGAIPNSGAVIVCIDPWINWQLLLVPRCLGVGQARCGRYQGSKHVC